MGDKDTIDIGESVLDKYTPFEPKNSSQQFVKMLCNWVDGPVTFFRESFIQPLKHRLHGEQQVYYHRKYHRVPTIDECYDYDAPCIYEADTQLRRDRLVDQEIVKLLYRRMRTCFLYNRTEVRSKCREVVKDYDLAFTNWFIKYGDIHEYSCAAAEVYYKQKHRYMFLRRHPDSNLMPEVTHPDEPPKWLYKTPHEPRPTVFWKNFWNMSVW